MATALLVISWWKKTHRRMNLSLLWRSATKRRKEALCRKRLRAWYLTTQKKILLCLMLYQVQVTRRVPSLELMMKVYRFVIIVSHVIAHAFVTSITVVIFRFPKTTRTFRRTIVTFCQCLAGKVWKQPLLTITWIAITITWIAITTAHALTAKEAHVLVTIFHRPPRSRSKNESVTTQAMCHVTVMRWMESGATHVGTVAVNEKVITTNFMMYWYQEASVLVFAISKTRFRTSNAEDQHCTLMQVSMLSLPVMQTPPTTGCQVLRWTLHMMSVTKLSRETIARIPNRVKRSNQMLAALILSSLAKFSHVTSPEITT